MKDVKVFYNFIGWYNSGFDECRLCLLNMRMIQWFISFRFKNNAKIALDENNNVCLIALPILRKDKRFL